MQTWTIICNVLAIYAFIQIVISKYIITKHNKRLEYYPEIIDGGNSETWDKEQEALRYSKTRKYKIVELLKKIF